MPEQNKDFTIEEIAAEANNHLGDSASSPAAPVTGDTVDLKAGTKLTLNNVTLFKSSTAMEVLGAETGTFYIWSDSVAKNRIRITNSTDHVGVDGKVTGWIDVEDAKVAAGGSAPTTQAFTPYLVNITASVLNVRKGPGTNYGITTTIKRGEVYTIVGEQNGWGKLKSGAGWIHLWHTKRGNQGE